MRHARGKSAQASGQRKTLQLCRQVERALMFVLSDSDDDVLRDLMIVAVEPAPHAGRLLVTTAPLYEKIDPIDATTRLQAARGWLRTEIAASIHRRKVPDLLFQCVTPDETE
jgi:ribosome-binding factor A